MICCRLEVAGDVISDRNVETIKCQVTQNLEADPSNSSNKKDYFVTVKLNAICNRPEVANDAISGEDVETFLDYVYANFSRKSNSVIM